MGNRARSDVPRVECRRSSFGTSADPANDLSRQGDDELFVWYLVLANVNHHVQPEWGKMSNRILSFSPKADAKYVKAWAGITT